MRNRASTVGLLAALLASMVHGQSTTAIAGQRGAQHPLELGAITQQAYVKASNPDMFDRFGQAVAISGDTMVIGASYEDSSATGVNGNQGLNAPSDFGAAYVFVRSGTTWTQQAYLKASNSGSTDGFGTAVAISGDTLVIGAPNEDGSATGVDGNQASNGAPDAGAAYVFVRSGTTWTQQAYLKASNTDAADRFGLTVAISGSTILVGAPDEDSGATGVNGDDANDGTSGAGAAYVFVRSGSTWTQQAYLKASNPDIEDFFGGSLAIAGDTIAVGAQYEDSAATGVGGNQADDSTFNAGAAYVFSRSGTTWSQQAYLKASNPDSVDEFGGSIAVSADTVVVGAYREGSSATGVDGDGLNDEALGAGAAYIFARSGTNWTQQAYLKASNTGEHEAFGWAVAVSGATVVVGAKWEKSFATGVNGDQRSESAFLSGAAYVFTRSGATWSQLAYVKASNTDGLDEFAFAVALSGDTAVIGAIGEDSSSAGVNGSQGNQGISDFGAAYVFDLDLLPHPWVDLGSGLAGVSGVPQFTGQGTLIGGDALTLALANAKPSSTTGLVFGLSQLDAAFKGGTLVPHPDFLLLGLPTDGSGALVINATWPTGVVSGATFWVQAWTADPAAPQGFSASNGLRGTAP